MDQLKLFEGESIKDDVKIINWKFNPRAEEYELYCVSPYFHESFGEFLEYTI